jgi:hypothetical protein
MQYSMTLCNTDQSVCSVEREEREGGIEIEVMGTAATIYYNSMKSSVRNAHKIYCYTHKIILPTATSKRGV